MDNEETNKRVMNSLNISDERFSWMKGSPHLYSKISTRG